MDIAQSPQESEWTRRHITQDESQGPPMVLQDQTSSCFLGRNTTEWCLSGTQDCSPSLPRGILILISQSHRCPLVFSTFFIHKLIVFRELF